MKKNKNISSLWIWRRFIYDFKNESRGGVERKPN